MKKLDSEKHVREFLVNSDFRKLTRVERAVLTLQSTNELSKFDGLMVAYRYQDNGYVISVVRDGESWGMGASKKKFEDPYFDEVYGKILALTRAYEDFKNNL